MDYNEEMQAEEGGRYGDPRRCPRHPRQVTSSPDGMHDAPCPDCEAAVDEEEPESPRNLLSVKAAKRFVLGGRAFITISNGKGEHFTFRVIKWHPKDRSTGKKNLSITKYFIGVLVSPDNENDYEDLGEILPQSYRLIQPPYKGRHHPYVSETDVRFRVAKWMLGHLFYEKPFEGKSAGYSLRHSGHCGRCGRKLTTPESIDTGFGPECSSVLGLEWKERKI